ncbi:MAG: hypothetical protein OXC29_29650 [Rhodococcus sp.]|nr:hypothetical protein [Rhodococcus sp. (in: high G+C Gram-positive bacteria)]
MLEADVERVVIVGGTGAVSAQVAADVRALGVAVTRVGSDNPAATSVEVATLMTGSCRELVQTDLSRVALLNSAAIADGLSAAAVLGVGAMMSPGMPLPTGPVPVLLVGDILPTEVSDYLAVTPRPEVSVRTVSVDAGVDVWLAAVGGTAVVPPAVMRAAVAAAAASPTANENHDCRPRGFNHGGYYLSSVTAGFPLPDWSASAVGPVRGSVVVRRFSRRACVPFDPTRGRAHPCRDTGLF